MQITAAIARAAGQPLTLETCELAEPAAGEVRVKVEACGICHTDIVALNQHWPVPLPAILGHEGVGRIEALGPDAGDFKVGDRVVMSFGSCGQCPKCTSAAPGYCENALQFQVMGRRLDGSSPLSQDGEQLTGHFFAQSSFASHAVASTQNMVKLDDDLPAELMAPLACGVQTGMAAVMVALEARESRSLAVIGCGAVGLSVIMAAKIVGCEPIIAVDLKPERLLLACEFGATHCLNGAAPDLKKQLRKLGGLDYAVDTSGVAEVMTTAFDVLRANGTLLCLGVSPAGSKLSLDLGSLLMSGKRVRGSIEGDAEPTSFIPQMIDYYRRGLLPLEKLVTSYPLSDINTAIDDAVSGVAIKPVLIM